jgi:hypothetical protein
MIPIDLHQPRLKLNDRLCLFIIKWTTKILQPDGLSISVGPNLIRPGGGLREDILKEVLESANKKIRSLKKRGVPMSELIFDKNNQTVCSCAKCTVKRWKEDKELYILNENFNECIQMLAEQEDFESALYFKQEAEKRGVKL